jgi:hypothetical protein
MDFDELRKEAIQSTQRASGKKWTDYNLHDPGVTILEQFSFVLTDIAYRTNLGIEELLFHSNNERIAERNAFIPANEAFTPGPLTIQDYRILFLDHFVDSIINCWIEPVVNHREGITGLFNLIIHVHPAYPAAEYELLKKRIRSYYNEHRNLCEDLEEIIIILPELINIDVQIDVSQEAVAEDVIAQILFEIENYLNPSIEFNSLEDLEAAGQKLDEIYDVPSHKHGFISKKQLGIKRNQFYLSKIKEFISAVKGVRSMKDLQLFKDGSPVTSDLIRVENHKYLTIVDSSKQSETLYGFKISVYKGGVANAYQRNSVVRKLEESQQRFIRNYPVQAHVRNKKTSTLSSAEIESYNSVQECFPSIYGVGVYTPAKEEGVLRQAQSEQLKGYLMLFDQFMANHLSQLSKVVELLSIDGFDADQFKTYYAQTLNGKVQSANSLVMRTLRSKDQIEEELERLHSQMSKTDSTTVRKIEGLKRELNTKNNLVIQLTQEHLDRFLKMNIESIKKDQTFENRQIIKLALELKRQKDSSNIAKKGKLSGIEDALRKLVSNELNKREQDSEYTLSDLEDLMFEFDDRLDRKNRILSHMLARFGERFSTDFQLKFNSSQREADAEKADKRLLALKSIFLKNIVSIHQKRACGIRFGQANIGTKTSLEEKVGILLDINVGKSSEGKKSIQELKSERLTATQIKKEKSLGGQIEYVSAKGKKKNDKVNFIVNSPHFIKYLFQFGLSISNYQIIKEKDDYALYFIPPTHEDATKLLETKSYQESQEKLTALLDKLHRISAENEYFRIVEHVLLRPQDSSFCNFFLLDETGDKVFESLKIGREDIQMSSAIDTLILAGYADNYKVEKTSDKDFRVIIRDSIGHDCASSTKVFLTELSAEKFIKSRVLHYKKEKGNFNPFIELDNKTRFFFQLMDESDNVLFISSQADEIEKQELRVEKFLDLALISENYEVFEDKKTNLLRLKIKGMPGDGIIQSESLFRSEADVNRFIVYSIKRFQNSQSIKSKNELVKYKRIDGRDAKDFNAVLSVVYPNWTVRFHNEEFLQLFKQTLISAIPAHLSLRMVGLNFAEMEEFDRLYNSLLTELEEVSFDRRNRITNLSIGILKLITDDQT